MTNPNDSVAPNFAISGDKSSCQGGLSKREHFAALAMQGLLSSPSTDQHLPSDFTLVVQQFAMASVEYADALIAALNEGAK